VQNPKGEYFRRLKSLCTFLVCIIYNDFILDAESFECDTTA
jgi:hypothetical protein